MLHRAVRKNHYYGLAKIPRQKSRLFLPGHNCRGISAGIYYQLVTYILAFLLAATVAVAPVLVDQVSGTLGRKYHDRNPAAFSLVVTVTGFLPGFTSTSTTAAAYACHGGGDGGC